MKYFLAVVILGLGCWIIVQQGPGWFPFAPKPPAPVYGQRSYGVGPVSYSEPVCVQNCPPEH